MRRFLSGLLAAGIFCAVAHAQPSADELARAIAARSANEGRVGEMVFDLTNASGATRQREALMLHADTGEALRIAIYFTMPAAIAETAFLSHDYTSREDENWLYLPATQRVRRLPLSERGDSFMGTDLTYGDIKDNFKFGLDDWTFRAGQPAADAVEGQAVLEGDARTPAIAKELGYGRFVARVDLKTLFPVWIEYFDPDGALLKRVQVLEQEQIGGAWTAMRFRVENLQTGHRTEVSFRTMTFHPDLSDDLFSPEALSFGAPRIDTASAR